ncbi:hypothetical protein GLOIN_2v1786892 [Rhizophagus irregularis DAOM 181602=DAOM 197198]|uniref:Uncharacterized protein n=1 Tax=Rhizophagus irregularis (strain DAOM 181602 / DAOM 197198 / MUCL 43194) TaxID=747089 RepID=A0A2P4P771_RHIID|nr:hypothetical protein GLOIN_2v1786892 [Rhizophagus irregularis DAOM 181602=DAOM 197198]POG61242.1 hypothetical protein GLOIN_2v1786892 [Rhizophagus irregularis DAOM 181602=DAOM 197198]|eukprot:XP_025168108.1 hypothetical protein GLOIN_2v1786892 [Rhizophagus irregularis DAOM 181602=DAOM 197198]
MIKSAKSNGGGLEKIIQNEKGNCCNCKPSRRFSLLGTLRRLERKVQDAAELHFEETEKEKERKNKKKFERKKDTERSHFEGKLRKASAMEQFNNRGVSRCETSINSVRSVKISVIFDMMFSALRFLYDWMEFQRFSALQFPYDWTEFRGFWLFGFRMTEWNFEGTSSKF